MRQNIKISKREMKEDKFTAFVLRAKDYILQNWIYFAGGIAAIIIIVVAVSLLSTQKVKSERQAAELYSQAMSEYRNGSHQLAIVDLRTIIDDHGSTSYARQAAFNLGNVYFAARNFPEAKKAFENYLADYQQGDKYFVTSAMAGIAASLAGDGNYKEAADKYREAAEKYPDFQLSAEYYLNAMENYIKAEEMESARVIYAKLEKDYEDSQQFLDATRLAAELKMDL